MKDFTLKDLDKLDAQFDEMKNIHPTEENSIKVFTKFRPTKIQRLMLDYMETTEVIRKNGASLENIVDLTMLLEVLLVKHFTSLSKELSKLDVSTEQGVSKLLAIAKKFADTGLFKDIISSFNTEEMEKVTELFRNSNIMSDAVQGILVELAVKKQKEDEGDGTIQES